MRAPGSFLSQITVVLAPIIMVGGCGQLGNGQIESGSGGSSAIGNSGTGGFGSSVGTGSGGSNSGTGSGGSSGSAVASDLPCDVANLLSSKCLVCHGARPAGGAPMSLTNYAQMTAPAISDPTKTMAVVAVSRMMNTTAPMPPVGYPQATSAEIASLQNWISAGYPMTGCSTVTPTPDAGTAPDPFSVAPTCTSGKTWTGGNDGSGSMQPGVACISCHKSSGGEAPQFTIAGTLYPTAHEPDQCNGANGSTDGAQVVITDANNKTITLTPNSVGNFYSTAAVALPFTAKVTYMGRQRDMVGSQTSGDCNACHTQNGTTTTTNGSPAPGRIILP
jgi:mono/diheme cytochrome c family protein